MNKKVDDLQDSLIAINFSKKEAAVYLALLELGKGTVTEITRRANINRTTGYTILNTLTHRGLVTISGKKPKQEYVAESPDKIVEILKNQIKKDQEYLNQANTLLPQLKPLFNFQDRPRVRFYEGKEGLETVYEDTLNSHESIRAYANVDDMHKALPNYFPRYYKRRADKNISIRAIIPTNKAGLERVTHDTEEKRESALVPADKYHFSPEINIYDNKVMIASLKENLGVIIESQEITDAMKMIYELAWAEAKRLDLGQRSSPTPPGSGS